MTSYRYLFADLLTNSIIGELPLTDVSFTQQLNSIGSFNGSLLLSGVDAFGLNVDAATAPARTAIYVDRDGVLVWGGIIWNREWKSASQKLTIRAQEFESYFQKRLISSDAIFENIDQLAIVRSLVQAAQDVPNGDIGVQLGDELSGVDISRTFYAYELKNLYQAMLDISKAENGFDFAIRVSYDGGGQPVKALELGYPRSGKIWTETDPTIAVFEIPSGNIVEYDYSEDGIATANALWTLGAGSNEGKVLGYGTDASKLADGWAILETSANYSDYDDQTLLNNIAAGQILGISEPPTIIKIVVPPYIDPVFGTYSLGDDCRVRILDDRFPEGLDEVYRIVSLSVNPGESGPERATLTLTKATV